MSQTSQESRTSVQQPEGEAGETGWVERETSHFIEVVRTEADGRTHTDSISYERDPDLSSTIPHLYLFPEDVKLELTPFRVTSFERTASISQPGRGPRTITRLIAGIRDDSSVEFLGANWETPEGIKGFFQYFLSDGKPVGFSSPSIQGPMHLGRTDITTEMARKYLELSTDPRFGRKIPEAVVALLIHK